MPLYHYRCQECDERWELRLPIAKRDGPCGPFQTCDACGALWSIVRVVTNAAIRGDTVARG